MDRRGELEGGGRWHVSHVPFSLAQVPKAFEQLFKSILQDGSHHHVILDPHLPPPPPPPVFLDLGQLVIFGCMSIPSQLAETSLVTDESDHRCRRQW